MKTKYLLILLALLTLTMPAKAYDFMVDGLCYNYNEDGTSVTVTKRNSSSPSYSNLSGALTIPSTVTCNGYTYSVTSIGKDAFYKCSGLTSVTIPNSVTSIGSDAFLGCTGLTSVTWNAKTCADFLEYKTAPFYNIRANIKTFTFGEGVEKIPACLCIEMSELTSVTIPNSVKSIGSSAFSRCSGLTSVTIGNSVKSIGSGAFNNCSGLTSVTIPNSVTSIGDRAFRDCTGLTSVTIPNSVKSIGSGAFNNCSGLTSVTIPNSVTSIGEEAFRYCSSLTSVTIGNSVTSIGDRAFRDCTGLTSVTWNAKSCANFSYLIDSPFYDARAKIKTFTFGEGVEKIPTNLCYNLSKLTSVTIPNSVTSIGGGAFEFCSGLTSVTIGNSVTSIGKEAFRYCSSLTSVTWNAKSYPNFSSYTSAPFYVAGGISNINNFTFGEEVEIIPAYLCYYMCKLTSMTIPNSVKSIGSSAFYGCNGLTSVTIGNSVTTIGKDAFYKCSGLTSVTIPNSVTSIGSSAFSSCSGLTSVTIGNSVTSIGKDAFYKCSGLTSVTIPNSVTYLSGFSDCTGLTSVTIPNSVTSIGNRAFSNCTGLTSVTIPNSVTSFGSYAFQNCSSLTSVNIGELVASIGEYAFSGCTGLTSVTWNPKSYADFTSDSSTPFYDARTNIKTFIFGEGVEKIPAYLCYKMSNMTSLSIGDMLETIGDCAFYHCDSLTSITFPNPLKAIGESAFSCCTSLTSITIPNSIISVGNYAFSGSGLKKVLWDVISHEDYYQFTGETVWVGDYGYAGFHYYSPFKNCKIEEFIFGDHVKIIPGGICAYIDDLKKLTMGKSVSSIRLIAFWGCKKLTEIYSYNTVPPQLASCWTHDIFFKVPSSAVVHVPIGYRSIYLASSWNNFIIVEDLDLSSIDNVVIDQPVNPLENPEEIKTIYTIDGRRLNPQDVSWLPNGIYIVNGKKILINRK